MPNTFPGTAGAAVHMHLAQELLTLINSNFIKHMQKFIAFANNKTERKKNMKKRSKQTIRTRANVCVCV